MSVLVRLLSKRRSGRVKKKTSETTPTPAQTAEPLKGYAFCLVTLLDGTEFATQIQKQALGSQLYSQVYSHLDLRAESHYFALQYLDAASCNQWLEPNKSLKKQLKGATGATFKFRFRVKFYSTDPTQLREELTRYYFFLQLKADVLEGRLPCAPEDALQLAAYALQSELGDYDPSEHSLALISEFRFVPRQSDVFEEQLLATYSSCRGHSPAAAELLYLDKAKGLDLYGVDMHHVTVRSCYTLGLKPV